jgi:hypothetical protein
MEGLLIALSAPNICIQRHAKSINFANIFSATLIYWVADYYAFVMLLMISQVNQESVAIVLFF